MANGRISIAVYKPRPAREGDLLALVRERLPLLRRLGLATDREHVVLRSRSGVIIEVSEWASDEAIERAHRTPEVLELWSRFEHCADFVTLASLEEAADLFATFEPVDD